MTPDQINQFFSFLYEGRAGEITARLRLIAGVIISALIAAMVVISLKIRQLEAKEKESEPSHEPPPGKSEIALPWQEVLKKIASPNAADWNLAVIRADAIFDAVTKDMGLPGETLGERLKQLDASKLTSLNDVWEAHKIRNRIAHEAGRTLSYEEARRAVALFGEALRELKYLPK